MKIRSLLLCVGCLAAALLAMPASAGNAAEGKLKVLVVTGGHDYDQPAFEALFRADEGLDCEFQSHEKGEPKPIDTITGSGIEAYDAIVLYDMYHDRLPRLTEKQMEAYASVIRGGKGLVVLHHALADFQYWPGFEQMIGGRYYLQEHTANGVKKPRSTYKHDLDLHVEIADPDHYITRGLEDFDIHDEAYGGLGLDPSAHVLLETEHEQSSPVVGWAKPYGKGRVVAIQLGHDRHAYENPSYRRLVSRSVRWVTHETPEDNARKPLFNGKDLSGWTAEGNARFTVENGILVGRQGPGGAAGDLYSEAEYGDFECEVTWAMSWPGNSGVWFRYVNGGKAYQADILEYKNPLCWSGSLYCGGKMFIATNEDPSIVHRDGWNTFLIRARGDHLVLHLNGRKVADIRDDSSARGKFGIQVHAGDQFADMAIRIADIRVRMLD